MTRITKPLRGRKPKKRLELGPMREALRDRRAWTRLGVVIAPEGGGPHWRIVGDNADILVEVELMPTSEVVEARLMGGGMHIVPDLGEEVLVCLPEGELTWMPTIVAILNNASTMPDAGGQGPAPQRIVIARPNATVLIHDGSGGAEELVKRSEFLSHGHPIVATGATSPTTGPVTALEPHGSAATFPGTLVLKAK
jgi:hypothetical protein